MDGDRAMSLLVQPDQWARCAHRATVLHPGGGVSLDWTDEEPAHESCAPADPAGLAFDRWCRAYRSRPAIGAVEVYETRRDTPPASAPGALARPLGLAVDTRQRLYVAESGARAVLVVDLEAKRALRRIRLAQGRPVDVAAHSARAVLLVRDPDALLLLDGRRAPRPGPALVRPRGVCHVEPHRVAPGPVVLWRRGATGVVADPDGTVLAEVDGASDVELTPDATLVVARGPGRSLRRFRREGGGVVEIEPVGAPEHDGGALAVAPDGRIAFTTARGLATTTGSVARHETEGTVTTYRLDSGSYRTRWGRLFVDACLPTGTALRVQFVTSDVDGEPRDAVPAAPPRRGAGRVPRPDLTPPLPSAALLEEAGEPAAVFRRPTGREAAWQADPDDLRTYECPVAAAPGRYLWLVLTLTGTVRVSPRVRAVRVERPGHRLLASLPRAWSRDDADAGFVHRFLAPAEGVLHELDVAAAQRAILLDPRATPREALAWLATFAGLVLDPRWSEAARRTLVAEAYRLFARRGTKDALIRILEIYLDRTPAIIEQWQLRGLGGAVIGTSPEGPAAPAVGGAARATGTLGRYMIGGSTPDRDSFRTAAHRFCVLVPGELTDEQREVVRGIVDAHRPAHTLAQISELGSGMRVGQRLHLRLTSFVGPGADWTRAVVGRTRVGGDGLIGTTPAVGSRLAETSTLGQVRVG
jgi:phage tail-like protein